MTQEGKSSHQARVGHAQFFNINTLIHNNQIVLDIHKSYELDHLLINVHAIDQYK